MARHGRGSHRGEPGGRVGNTGAEQVAIAPPDGYTFLLSVNAPLVYNTLLDAKLPCDPVRDLVPSAQESNLIDAPEPWPWRPSGP
jgi:tripartite-type tricarboxylate transporter receptor subunit TctC